MHIKDLFKIKNGKINFAITGDVFFKILRNNSTVEEGKCYQELCFRRRGTDRYNFYKKFCLWLSSNWRRIKIKKFWDSYSINTKANIGPNNGKKLSINEKIFIKNINKNKRQTEKLIIRMNQIIYIRVIKGTNFDYFSAESQSKFFKEEYSVTNLTDRMGMRLKGLNFKKYKKYQYKIRRFDKRCNSSARRW